MDPSSGASGVASGAGSSGTADSPFANFKPSGITSRIGPTGFTAGIFTVLTLSIITILARVFLRLQRTKSLACDDYFLVVALISLIGACATQQHYRDITYTTINVESGNQIPPPDFAKNAVVETQVLDATSVLLWVSIFCVKFSFLFFFRKLITRIRYLQLYWWVVFGVVLPSALVCIPLGFIECAYFGQDLLEHCPVDSLIAKEHIYLDVTIVLDILTDVLIISLPVALLWNVKIDLTKKLTLIGMFGLSVVMIVIALIRVAMATLTPTIIDTPWIFFWQIMEASIALIMVSVSAFRGLFGQGGSSNGYNKGEAYLRNKANRAAGQNHNAVNDAEKGQSHIRKISGPSNLKVLASGDPERGFATMLNESAPSSRDEGGFEMRAVSHPEKRMTTYEERQKELPTAPGTPGTPGMGYARAESPMTARCWSDAPPVKQDRRRSLSRASSQHMKEKVKQMRARSRTPSLGEALIEERERRTVPKDWV